MPQIEMLRWPRLPIIRAGVVSLAMLAISGCGNADEGTITVSPEARARLRGGPPPSPATDQAAAKPATKQPGARTNPRQVPIFNPKVRTANAQSGNGVAQP